MDNNEITNTLIEMEIAANWGTLLRKRVEFLAISAQATLENKPEISTKALERVAEIDQAIGIFKANIK